MKYLSLLVLILLPATLLAASPEFTVNIKNHRFEPAEIRVPAGQKFKLIVHNLDPTPEEFESHILNIEKIISGGRKATIRLKPLKPGTYAFFGEFHEDTAQGVVIAE